MILSFESLPQQVATLTEQVQRLTEVIECQNRVIHQETDTINLNDVCKETGYSRANIYRLTSSGQIPHFKPKGSNKLIFSRKAIVEWMQGGKKETKQEYCDRKENELLNRKNGGLN